MFRILIVEDEESIRKLVQYNLVQAGYEILEADNGLTAIEMVKTERPDLVILDVMLPGLNGVEVCQQMRRQGLSTPIIMLTARDDEVDRILGLEMGADDYVTKPFSPRELAARVKAVLRRSGDDAADTAGVYQCGDISVDINKYEVTIRGEKVDLTPREFELLHYLMKNRGRVLARDQLLDKVWGYEFAGDTRIVDVHISHLRDKLEKEPKNPRYIKTIRGVGYKLVEGEA
ncbi:response regulator transcription factor [Effusibacillus dendaii]|uniref:DNA-binding response regulator n=1 Tax=Effusibacillus dendaii TaxID=2743772 RepID=A0A7I8DCV3_9BACL|nr:response regulator transcription factor [Effusibacillus dendaii]BCJ87857.1 DNA-binding response regulator [Effusibacillus dendaii]